MCDFGSWNQVLNQAAYYMEWRGPLSESYQYKFDWIHINHDPKIYLILKRRQPIPWPSLSTVYYCSHVFQVIAWEWERPMALQLGGVNLFCGRVGGSLHTWANHGVLRPRLLQQRRLPSLQLWAITATWCSGQMCLPQPLKAAQHWIKILICWCSVLCLKTHSHTSLKSRFHRLMENQVSLWTWFMMVFSSKEHSLHVHTAHSGSLVLFKISAN